MSKILHTEMPSLPEIEAGLKEITENKIISRLWAHDHTIWKPEPTEITNRLGWLHIIESMHQESPRMQALVNDLKREGFSDVLLLGMGGSSLAPEVFSHTFESSDGLNLSVLDSTDPDAVLAAASGITLKKTLFIVATKSGGTVETLSFFKYFYNRVIDAVGEDKAGAHFIAITDPGSKLVDLAEKHAFREIFLNDPNIGGRYSALSFFGLVPATLAGVDVPKLLRRAQAMADQCAGDVPEHENPGAVLGTIMGIMAKAGRDKITFVAPPSIRDFPNWVEQLIAESTGKEGRGILPIVGEPLGLPDLYRNDRVFVSLQVGENSANETMLQKLETDGHPVLRFQLDDIYDLGGQFFLWELATAVAGYFLEINPFDQPNVESAKVLARQMVKTYRETGSLPAGNTTEPSAAALNEFLAQAKPGDYVAFQAYVHPTPEIEAVLQKIRLEAHENLKAATTLGFGPRFLHSTGQLHKGDAGNSIFIQFTSQSEPDVDIPDEAGKAASTMTFGTLKTSQALGDAQALRDAGRRVISFSLGKNPIETLKQLS